MTTGEAISLTHFWLDQYADWFSDREVCVALNRATTEWVLGRYESGLGDERSRREVARLIPTPKQGSGNRIVLADSDGIWLVLAVETQWKDDGGALLEPSPCQPASEDTIVERRRSKLRKPTNRYPVYTTRRQSNGDGMVLEIYSSTPPDSWSLHYLTRPMALDHTQQGVVWNDVPDFAQQEIIQIAKRMLLSGQTPDYSAQVNIEEPKAGGVPTP